MNSAEQPTQANCQAQTILKTTDLFCLPAAVLVEDARRGAACAIHVEAVDAPAAGAAVASPAGLEGHEFILCLERSPLGEMWRLRGPDGGARLAFCLHRETTVAAELRLQRLQTLRHAALPPVQVVHGPAEQVVLLTAAPSRTLAGWFKECRLGGLAGIPRAELLRCLRAAAEALDQLFRQHGLQHLGLQPANIWLEARGVQLAGFGLAQLFGLPATGSAIVNPRYAAPELLQGRSSLRCDQYSLALIYAEMVSGVHPVEGAGAGRLNTRGSGRLELALLGAGEREAIARALHPDPNRRFPNCAAFLESLQAAQPLPNSRELARPPASLPVLVATGPLAKGPASLDQFVRELLALAAGPAGVRNAQNIRYHLEGGQSLTHHCAVNLFPGAALLKLEGFRQTWGAVTVLRDREAFVFSVRTSANFWERLIGRQVGLEIHIRMTPPARATQKLAEVGVVIRPFGCGRARAVRLLEEMGPLLLESLRSHLQALPEQRAQERLLWNEKLRVHPVVAGLPAIEAIECVGKDISARGIGFFLPQPLAASHVYVNHPGRPDLAEMAALAKVVRGQRCPDGWYEVGALFTPEESA